MLQVLEILRKWAEMQRVKLTHLGIKMRMASDRPRISTLMCPLMKKLIQPCTIHNQTSVKAHIQVLIHMVVQAQKVTTHLALVATTGEVKAMISTAMAAETRSRCFSTSKTPCLSSA